MLREISSVIEIIRDAAIRLKGAFRIDASFSLLTSAISVAAALLHWECDALAFPLSPTFTTETKVVEALIEKSCETVKRVAK